MLITEKKARSAKNSLLKHFNHAAADGVIAAVVTADNHGSHYIKVYVDDEMRPEEISALPVEHKSVPISYVQMKNIPDYYI